MNAEPNIAPVTRGNLLKDFSWYLLSSFFPLLVGFIKTPVFTRHFGAEDFGNLGIVQATFTYFGMVLFSWISSILWRYYQKYKIEGRIAELFGMLVLLVGISMVLLAIFSWVWYANTSEGVLLELIAVSFFHLIFSQLVMGYLVTVRLEAKAKLYTLIQSVRALLSLFLSLYLVFILDLGIASLITGLLIIDGFVFLVLLIWNPINLTVSLKGSWRGDMKVLLSYGMAGLILNLSLLSLSLSDRYVILAAEGMAAVGVYDQVYKISQLSVVALVTVFFNTVNAQLFRELEEDFNRSLGIMSRYLITFIGIGLPLVSYFSLFSREISEVLLGVDFRDAYTIMPFVFFASFFAGLSNFWELRLKFSGRMRILTMTFFAGALFNLILNLWLVPLYGYLWAAISTLLTYSILLLFLVAYEKKLLRSFFDVANKLFIPLVVLGLQLLFYGLVENFEPPSYIRILMGLIFVISYGWLFKRSGIPR